MNIGSVNKPQTAPAQLRIAGCPHGNTPGACPVCSGGGGGGGSAKLKQPGLMTWNEAFAEWTRLQNIMKRNIENKVFYENVQKKADIQILPPIFINKVIIKAANFIQQNIFYSAARATLFISQPFVNLAKTVINVAYDRINQISQNLNKYYSQLNDNFGKLMEKFVSIIAEQEKILKEFVSDKLRKVKKKFFSLLAMISGEMEQGEEDEEKEEAIMDTFFLSKNEEMGY